MKITTLILQFNNLHMRMLYQVEKMFHLLVTRQTSHHI